MKRSLIALVGALVAFGVVTLIALEGREVVVLKTVDPGGHARETRAWIAEENGEPWIEAASPERGFYRDVIAGSAIEIDWRGGLRSYRAAPAPNPQGHQKIRRLLRAKYGWADRWIGLLADTSSSIGIRLVEIQE
jgi:hypothetical protein